MGWPVFYYVYGICSGIILAISIIVVNKIAGKCIKPIAVKIDATSYSKHLLKTFLEQCSSFLRFITIHALVAMPFLIFSLITFLFVKFGVLHSNDWASSFLPSFVLTIMCILAYILVVVPLRESRKQKADYYDALIGEAREIYSDFDNDTEIKNKVLEIIESIDFSYIGTSNINADNYKKEERIRNILMEAANNK